MSKLKIHNVRKKLGTRIEKYKSMSIIFDKTKDRNKAQEIGETSVEIEEYKKRLEQLYEVAQKASSVSEVSKLLEEILGMIQQIIRVSASSLLLIDDKKGELYFQAADKQAGNKLSQMTISLDSGIANRVLRHGRPLIINDVTRDERFNKEIDKVTGFITKSVMAVPLFRGQKVIGILEAINRVDGQEFNEPDLAVLTGFASTEALTLLVSMVATATNNIEQHQILIDWYKSMMETLIAAADNKDPYASGHSSRVKKYTMLAANSLPFSLEDLQAIELGALLHDIGKLWIHDIVLRKPGPLTDEEWHIMRKHALKGAHMLSGIPYLEKVRDIVLYHHERYDGKGYPQGLKGKDIPIGARLVAVADAYDTMTTAHSYRDKMNIDDAIKQLIKGSGTQFCPVAVKAFISAVEKSQEEAVKIKAERSAEEKAKRDAKELTRAEDAAKANNALGLETYEGDVTLMITSPDSSGQVKQFKKYLEKVDNLKIVLEGWSEAEGTVIVVSVPKPVALTSILNKMPIVEKVDKKNNHLVVMLKPSSAGEVFKHGFSLVWPR
jgi:putative nucleotidyltransferase with HDIG domain